ncbi:GIY-YIG nuclease family protein [Arthrobacter sp. NicSoilC5]|uniref:GIY-YIG nuclease family protein n=1 Tax=Arthrobacter sp. NicSoilC5 TaxID=2831000 RepID=UPI001CC6DC83|nr:GIY-YIG nuclease family protein [Arthrobacter sp. NicSoilC5]BCW78904.1 hypothetical protein NicSoilC5_09230 [Arthrobacter sp. NicSoilC5]
MTETAPEAENDRSYEFRGAPLVPSMLVTLAPRIIAADTFRRSELASAGEEFHLANGGLKSNGAQPAQQAKKAISDLYSKGIIEPAGGQYWRWTNTRDQVISDIVQVAAEPENDSEVGFDISDDVITEGVGTGNLYVYFFPTYKELAESRNEARWPIKIGMTATGSAASRISDQVGTALPEAPLIAYIRRTDTPAKLERLVHSVLHFRGQTIEDAPGSEWFLSSPEEVKGIVDWVFSSSSS